MPLGVLFAVVLLQDVAKSVNEIKRDIEALNTSREIQNSLLDYKVRRGCFRTLQLFIYRPYLCQL